MEKILSDLLELITLDAISFDERRIADAVKAKLTLLGADELYEDDAGEKIGGNTGNIFARFEGTLPGAVMFSAHMDRMPKGFGIEPVIRGRTSNGEQITVTGSELESLDNFTPERVVSKGDTILAADDLTGIAAILDGIRRLRESGRPHSDVELLITVCEEKGLLGAHAFDYKDVKSRICYALDSPGALGRVLYAAPHSAKLELEVFGQAAYAGQAPEKGKSATVGAAKILATLTEGRLDRESTSNFPIFRAGGDATNAVCDYAYVKGEARSLSREKLDRYLEYFQSHCRKEADAFGVTVKTECQAGTPGFTVPLDGPAIRLISGAFDAMGIKPVTDPSGGGMDANIYNTVGIESVGVGTGYFANHTTDEYVELDSFLRSGEMVYQIIAAYSADPSEFNK